MSRNGVPVTRRDALRLLAGAGTVSLAGCTDSSGTGGGGDSESSSTTELTATDRTARPTEQTFERAELDSREFLSQWIHSTEQDDVLLAASFRPSRLVDEYGESVTEYSYGDPYEPLQFSPEDVPASFVQSKNEPAYSTVKVDQLPPDVSFEHVLANLREQDFEVDREVGDYHIYRTPSANMVYALAPGRMITGLNFDVEEETMNAQHTDHVVNAIEEYDSETVVTADIERVLGSLGGEDFIELWGGTGDGAQMVGRLADRYQPGAGGVGIDLDSGIKYGAWAFEDENIAEEVYEGLQEVGTRSEYGWERIDRSGQVITAQGAPQIEQRLHDSPGIPVAIPKI